MHSSFPDSFHKCFFQNRVHTSRRTVSMHRSPLRWISTSWAGPFRAKPLRSIFVFRTMTARGIPPFQHKKSTSEQPSKCAPNEDISSTSDIPDAVKTGSSVLRSIASLPCRTAPTGRAPIGLGREALSTNDPATSTTIRSIPNNRRPSNAARRDMTAPFREAARGSL